MTIQISMEQVTPKLAATYLSTQRENRNIRKYQVRQWAEDMKEGNFPAIAQPIMFDEDGLLIDGQHRLSAVLESGVSLQMYVARNVPSEHRRFIDGGLNRRPSDVLRLDYNMPNQNTTTAIANMVLMYQHHRDFIWSATTRPSKQQIIDEVVDNFDLYQTAGQMGQSATSRTPSQMWLTRSGYGALYILVERYSQVVHEWESFTEGVVTGANLDKGDPRLTLRSSAVPSGITGTNRSQGSVIAGIKTWNAYVRGEELHLLRVAPQRNVPMPQVL